MLLGIDTTLPNLSLALADKAKVLVKYQVQTPLQGDYLIPILRDFLAQNAIKPTELTAVVCTTGPGSFTGVRIGLACARAMGLALGIPVHGVSTFDALAYGLSPITVLIDTLRGDYYAQEITKSHEKTPFIFDSENGTLTTAVTGILPPNQQTLFPKYVPPKFLPAEAACLIALEKPDFLTLPTPLYVREADVTV